VPGVTTLDDQTVAEYLDRIDAPRPHRTDVASLAALQVAHLLRVPFENLDIHRGVPIVLELDAIVDKVVHRRRGGYCYELNGAFGALLTALGYGVDLAAARVARPGRGYSQPLAHMALVVTASDGAAPLLVDVGFGDAFTAPIQLAAGPAQPDRERMVRVTRDGADWVYEEDRGGGWEAQYAFTTSPRRLEDFAAMNEWQQTSPESHFTTGTICSLLTDEGRMTISGSRFIVTNGVERLERELLPREVEATLRDRFGVA
jgi:N-hydroxyarylamine O-acetyltransferase